MHDEPRRSGWVRVDGATLHYVVEGAGVPALVIGSCVYYPRTFSRPLRESLRLAFVDVRHFAEREPAYDPARITLDTYLRDLEAVRERAGFERGVVIGHSHHGNLALEYARRFPSRASHVVLIGSPPVEVRRVGQAADAYWEAHASGERKAALREGHAALDAGRRAAMSPADAWVAEYVADGARYWYDAERDASCLWRGVPVDLDAVARFRGFFADGYELAWDPGRMRAPVLVVMGRHDYAVPHTLWDDARPRLPPLAYHLLERSGHTPQLEEPERFDRVLLDWLRREPAARLAAGG